MSRNQTSINNSKLPTRERLLEAAIDVFGIHGYEGSTTRKIAKKASVNISSIPYYFSGKEGLYRAVIEQFVGMAATHFSAIREQIEETDLTAAEAKTNATTLLEQLLNGLIQFMIGSPEGLRRARLILHEQLAPSPAYKLIFTGFMEPMLNDTALLLQVNAPNLTPRTAKLKAIALIGQIISFRLARETVVRALDMEGYSEAEVNEVSKIIMAHTRAIITEGSQN